MRPRSVGFKVFFRNLRPLKRIVNYLSYFLIWCLWLILDTISKLFEHQYLSYPENWRRHAMEYCRQQRRLRIWPSNFSSLAHYVWTARLERYIREDQSRYRLRTLPSWSYISAQNESRGEFYSISILVVQYWYSEHGRHISVGQALLPKLSRTLQIGIVLPPSSSHSPKYVYVSFISYLIYWVMYHRNIFNRWSS